jgi:N-acetylglucosamine kinase-like BadF-type ATPase
MSSRAGRSNGSAVRIVVGVDGGQTATLAVVCDQTGRLLGWGTGGPANHIHEPGGLERRDRSLADAIGGALGSAGLAADTVVGAGLGLTGGWKEAVPVVQSRLPKAKVISEWDVVTCLIGARAGQPGVVLIAGTGSVAFGINAAGQRADAGGWGYFLGDQGSAYDVGHAAIQAVVKALDGRGPQTTLSPEVFAHLEAPDLKTIYDRYHAGHISRATIAGLAVPVAAQAEQGDAVAQQILSRAAQELASMVSAVVRRLWPEGESVVVCPVGGLFRAGKPLLDPFRAALSATASAASLEQPRFPPVLGAVILALERLAVPLTDAVFETLGAARDEIAALK